MSGPRRRSAGFTLIELLITLLILGILAGIAIPSFKRAIFKAEAAKIMSDMEAVRLAVMEFREDNGSLPRTGPWGTVPNDLIPYLGDRAFTRDDIAYRVVTNRRRGRVIFDVRYENRSPVGAELKKFRRAGRESGSVLWRSNRTRFFILNNNR